jgi:hypothetical protein
MGREQNVEDGGEGEEVIGEQTLYMFWYPWIFNCFKELILLYKILYSYIDIMLVLVHAVGYI